MQERVMRHYLSSLRNLSEFFLINFIDPLTSVDSKILKITDPIKLNLTSLLLINLTLKNTINKVVFIRYPDSFLCVSTVRWCTEKYLKRHADQSPSRKVT